MTDEDLAVENALLRGALFLAARALKDYHDAPHVESKGMMQVKVPSTLRPRAARALTGAEKILKSPEQRQTEAETEPKECGSGGRGR